jgi:nucleolar protein 56
LHFPELGNVVEDNFQYIRIVAKLKDKSNAIEEAVRSLTEITADEKRSRKIIEIARTSTGQDMSISEMNKIETFAKLVIQLAEYREKLHRYLNEKTKTIAPNLSRLIGEFLSARLIAHAGSLLNLAKYPASTLINETIFWRYSFTLKSSE